MRQYQFIGFHRERNQYTNNALLQWLFLYGYNWALHDDISNTDLDHHIWWEIAVSEGVLEMNDIDEDPAKYRLTPKVHEYLEQFNGNDNSNTSSPVA